MMTFQAACFMLFQIQEDELATMHYGLVNNANLLPIDLVATFMKDNNIRLQIV